jgi:hypothetical protein
MIRLAIDALFTTQSSVPNYSHEVINAIAYLTDCLNLSLASVYIMHFENDDNFIGEGLLDPWRK